MHVSSLVMIGHDCHHYISSRLVGSLPRTRHIDTNGILGDLPGQISLCLCIACLTADCETSGEVVGDL